MGEREKEEEKISSKVEEGRERAAGSAKERRATAPTRGRSSTRSRPASLPLPIQKKNLLLSPLPSLRLLSAPCVSSASTATRSSSPRAKRGWSSSTSTSRTSACG